MGKTLPFAGIAIKIWAFDKFKKWVGEIVPDPQPQLVKINTTQGLNV